MSARTVLRCWACLTANDAHDAHDPDLRPYPGALSMCWRCGQLGIFTGPHGSLTVDGDPGPVVGIRKPTTDEQADLDVHPEVVAMRKLWKNALSADPRAKATDAVVTWRQQPAPEEGA